MECLKRVSAKKNLHLCTISAVATDFNGFICSVGGPIPALSLSIANLKSRVHTIFALAQVHVWSPDTPATPTIPTIMPPDTDNRSLKAKVKCLSQRINAQSCMSSIMSTVLQWCTWQCAHVHNADIVGVAGAIQVSYMYLNRHGVRANYSYCHCPCSTNAVDCLILCLYVAICCKFAGKRSSTCGIWLAAVR